MTKCLLWLLVAVNLFRLSMSIFVEKYGQHSHFEIGQYHFQTLSSQDNRHHFSTLGSCLSKEGDDIVAFVFNKLMSSRALNILQIPTDTIYSSPNYIVELSHQINSCAVGKSNEDKEFLFQCAISVFPQNVVAIRNLGHMLEWVGKWGASRQLFEDCITLTGDKGCQIHAALVSPTLLWDERQHGREIYLRTLKLLFSIIRRNVTNQYLLQRNSGINNTISSTSSTVSNIAIHSGVSEEMRLQLDSPMINLREMPLNFQYIGHDPNRVTHLLALAIVTAYPSLNMDLTGRKDVQKVEKGVHTIRLGIVGEHDGNSSPGLCLHRILQRLVERSSLSLFTNNKSDSNKVVIEIVFFDRAPGSYTVFAAATKNIAVETSLLDGSDLDTSRERIAAAKVDILLYLALPTEKFTYFLSMARLAPVQIQYGIGHPLSSGSAAIDYSVVAGGMLPADITQLNSNSPLDAITCGFMAQLCSTDHLQPSQPNHPNNNNRSIYAQQSDNCVPDECLRSSYIYTEQLVQFDSLGYFLQDPVEMYADDHLIVEQLTAFSQYRPVATSGEHDGKVDDTSQLSNAAGISCDFLDGKLAQWGLSTRLTARDIGCFEPITSSSDSTDTPGTATDTTDSTVNTNRFTIYPRQIRLYNAMHIVKKLHPLYDKVLLGILSTDSAAVIVALESMRHIYPRLRSKLSQYNLSEYDLTHRILLIPRMPHSDYLQLLSLSVLYLNPFPFGSGITSSEAIAMCVPVIVLPEETAVLHFAAAQVNTLGSDLAELLIVHDLDTYVSRAVSIARGNVMPLSQLKNTICERKDRLFGADVLETVTKEWETFLTRL